MFHLLFTIPRRLVRSWKFNVCVKPLSDRHAWSTCGRLVQRNMKNITWYLWFSYGNAWSFSYLLMACGQWGHVFSTSANPRSCTYKMAVSPSFTARMGENVKTKC